MYLILWVTRTPPHAYLRSSNPSTASSYLQPIQAPPAYQSVPSFVGCQHNASPAPTLSLLKERLFVCLLYSHSVTKTSLNAKRRGIGSNGQSLFFVKPSRLYLRGSRSSRSFLAAIHLEPLRFDLFGLLEKILSGLRSSCYCLRRCLEGVNWKSNQCLSQIHDRPLITRRKGLISCGWLWLKLRFRLMARRGL